MSLHTLGWVDESFSASAGLLASKLTEYLAGLRPAHPVSILDVSPHAEAGLHLARWVRRLQRKVRFMTYDWQGGKAGEFHAAAPEVLVEKGALPGVHFSSGSFDFVVGVDVLAGAEASLRGRIVADFRRTALRLVLLVENEASLTRAELDDLLLVAAPGRATQAVADGLCLIAIRPPEV